LGWLIPLWAYLLLLPLHSQQFSSSFLSNRFSPSLFQKFSLIPKRCRLTRCFKQRKSSQWTHPSLLKPYHQKPSLNSLSSVTVTAVSLSDLPPLPPPTSTVILLPLPRCLNGVSLLRPRLLPLPVTLIRLWKVNTVRLVPLRSRNRSLKCRNSKATSLGLRFVIFLSIFTRIRVFSFNFIFSIFLLIISCWIEEIIEYLNYIVCVYATIN